ncbi:MAG: AI-2E family transporter [Novosphingobium sp.]|nr:AI-2E family transporter [Novosphingobium sp.]
MTEESAQGTDEPTAEAPTRRAGPTDFSGPVRQELTRAMVWLGMASLIALCVLLANSLLIIFGGVVFAAMIDGGARLLGRVLKIAHGWRVAIVLLLAVAFLVWTADFAGNQIAHQAAALPAIVESQWLVVLAWLEQQQLGFDASQLKDIAGQVMGGIGQLSRAVGGIIGAVTTTVLILVLGLYFALEPHLYNRGVSWLLPRDRRDHFRETAQIMGRALRRLLAGRLLGMAITGILTWMMLALYGVPMAALLGLLTGLLAFLPNIGALISGVLMVLVGFSGGLEMGLYTVFVYIFIQTVEGFIISPMVARKTADLPPALVLGAQLIMGVLFGFLGMLLADPMVTMLKVWLEREAQRNDEPGPEPEAN